MPTLVSSPISQQPLLRSAYRPNRVLRAILSRYPPASLATFVQRSGSHTLKRAVAMLMLQTKLRVDGITAREIFDFLANPNDQAYQQWWPGTHLQLHPLKRTEDHVGDVIYMDEYIGERRLRITGIVVEAVPERKLVWQLRKLITLPARLSLDLTDDESGVAITHTIEAGFKGPGTLMDPLIRLYFSEKFAAALDDHVKTEFPLLRDRLPQIKPELGAR